MAEKAHFQQDVKNMKAFPKSVTRNECEQFKVSENR
eukprot:CAMPEP_0183774078 /NCGR_PEP_ID=MMETSP0739-20130205/40979_1 /TAXON_ID=385413 /ORGANISM="Thalassiosira miniscula, Strain CCMP1093" /LENGTH=35 /DNA_ID= /DNA_START= /DNA_END= /DNA_ORIENTATION=